MNDSTSPKWIHEIAILAELELLSLDGLADRALKNDARRGELHATLVREYAMLEVIASGIVTAAELKRPSATLHEYGEQHAAKRLELQCLHESLIELTDEAGWISTAEILKRVEAKVSPR